MLGDWQLNGIATLHSGVPLGLRAGGTTRPNVAGTDLGLNGTVQSRVDRYYDPAAFAIPALLKIVTR